VSRLYGVIGALIEYFCRDRRTVGIARANLAVGCPGSKPDSRCRASEDIAVDQAIAAFCDFNGRESSRSVRIVERIAGDVEKTASGWYRAA
jgi:hypothetical protein